MRQCQLIERTLKLCVPSLIMGNMKSLSNKMDEVTALAQSQKYYGEWSLMSFTETWLHQDVPCPDVELCPSYIPREFSHVLLMAAIPPCKL